MTKYRASKVTIERLGGLYIVGLHRPQPRTPWADAIQHIKYKKLERAIERIRREMSVSENSGKNEGTAEDQPEEIEAP